MALHSPNRGPHCTGLPSPSAIGLHNTGTHPSDMFKLVHYEARTVGSGQFASYWNAFLFVVSDAIITIKTGTLSNNGGVDDSLWWGGRYFQHLHVENNVKVKVIRGQGHTKVMAKQPGTSTKVIILTQEQYRTEIIVNSGFFFWKSQ